MKLTKAGNLIEIGRGGIVRIDLDKPVGKLLLSKIIEILEIIDEDKVDKDND